MGNTTRRISLSKSIQCTENNHRAKIREKNPESWKNLNKKIERTKKNQTLLHRYNYFEASIPNLVSSERITYKLLISCPFHHHYLPSFPLPPFPLSPSPHVGPYALKTALWLWELTLSISFKFYRNESSEERQSSSWNFLFLF